MNHQFKAGDLALLIGSDLDELVGSVVELVEYMGDGPMISYVAENGRRLLLENFDLNRIWRIRLIGKTYTSEKVGGPLTEGPCRQQRLLPLKGDFASDLQKSREVAA